MNNFFFPRHKAYIPTSKKTGAMIPARIPILIVPAALDTKPTKVGPPEHPRSPANASIAKSKVPPLRNAADALLKVPGHIIPTEKPQIPQPISSTIGIGTRDIQR